MKTLKLTLAVVVALGVAGCGHSSRRQQAYEEGRAEILASYISQTYAVSCAKREGIFKVQQCPMLISKEFEIEQQSQIANVLSSKSKGEVAEKTKSLMALNDRIAAKVTLRYRFADFQEVSLKCQAEPKKCQTQDLYELMILISHNAKLFELAKVAVSRYDSDYANSLLEQRRHDRIVEAVEQSRGPTNCTGTTFGSIVTVSCK